jgi:hypothetical protein
VDFSILFLDLCGVLLFISLELNKWYQSTFFGHEKGKFFFLFLQGFQKKKKKRVVTLQSIHVDLCVQNLMKLVVDLSSSRKNNHFQKKNRLNQSSGGQDITDLKSTVFQGFCGRSCDFADFCSNWCQIFPNKLQI